LHLSRYAQAQGRGLRTSLTLQERFGLANQHLTLLNGTLIPYRQLTVPCCQTCNNVHLSKLEKRVQTLLFDSSIAAARRDLKDIYILGKQDPSRHPLRGTVASAQSALPQGASILPHNWRDAFNMTHFLSRSAMRQE
jgi:hypothetical protein